MVQILTGMKLLPGTLVLNDSNQFICDRVECNISYKNINYDTTLCIQIHMENI